MIATARSELNAAVLEKEPTSGIGVEELCNLKPSELGSTVYVCEWAAEAEYTANFNRALRWTWLKKGGTVRTNWLIGCSIFV